MRRHQISVLAIACALAVGMGCSSPTRPAEVIPAPVLPVVPDVRPAAGTHPYRLTLHLPECVDRFGPVHPSYLDYTFDDELVVEGNSLQMTLPEDGNAFRWPEMPFLTLTIERRGDQLTGTIGGKNTYFGHPRHGGNSIFLKLMADTTDLRATSPITGTAEKDGRLTGSFDAYLQAIFISSGGFTCHVPGMTFTLDPLP